MSYLFRQKVIYLLKARHRRGHGIHSPFLFRLITAVMENDGFYSAYPALAAAEENVRNMLKILNESSWIEPDAGKGPAIHLNRDQYLLPARFNRLLFRLVNDFSPCRISFFGNTFGVTLLALAFADGRILLGATVPNNHYRLFCQRLAEEYNVANIVVTETGSIGSSDFVVVQYPEDPAFVGKMVAQIVGQPGFGGVAVLCGIHTSREMEAVWNSCKQLQQVRVSLDLFEIGILICDKGLQKEGFVVRF